jgi:aerobic-type carbon monoxide dehydrogenase small subunit (CoxS/CutS family)
LRHILTTGLLSAVTDTGLLVTAKALLDRNPDPTVDEIKKALSGNLCRCGTYVTHIKAIQEAAKKLKAGK